jgi:hypothetical protein
VPSGFGTPVEVLTGQFRDVSEVVDSTNHVHIAATGRHGLWYITDRGGSWIHTRILHDLVNKSWVEPSIALDTNDRVYISVAQSACDDCTPGSSTGIYYLTDKGRARGTFPISPTRIAPARSGEGTLKVSNGHLFLSFVKPCCMPGPRPKVLLRTNATGGWTTVQIAPHGDQPALRIGSDGRPRVAFDKAAGIFYAVASSPAGSFAKFHVPGTTNADVAAQLAIDASGRPHLAWFHDTLTTSDIWYGWQSSAGWQGPIQVAPNTHGGFMAFDLDSLGRPNVVHGHHTLKNLVLSGGTWHATVVASAAGAEQMDLRRAFAGHVVVCWRSGNGGIFVSRN